MRGATSLVLSSLFSALVQGFSVRLLGSSQSPGPAIQYGLFEDATYQTQPTTRKVVGPIIAPSEDNNAAAAVSRIAGSLLQTATAHPNQLLEFEFDKGIKASIAPPPEILRNKRAVMEYLHGLEFAVFRPSESKDVQAVSVTFRPSTETEAEGGWKVSHAGGLGTETLQTFTQASLPTFPKTPNFNEAVFPTRGPLDLGNSTDPAMRPQEPGFLSKYWWTIALGLLVYVVMNSAGGQTAEATEQPTRNTARTSK